MGKQSLWPSTKEAQKYDEDEAKDIAAQHNAGKTMWNGHSHGHAHVKPESTAHEYVSGEAYYKVKRMTETYEGSMKDLVKDINEFYSKAKL